MDAETRKKIMETVMGKNEPEVVTGGEPVYSESKPSPASIDNLYKFRHLLGKVHKFEAILKKDDFEWDESDWESFKKFIGESNKPKSTDTIIENVLQKKLNRELNEADEKHKIRQMILGKLDLKW